MAANYIIKVEMVGLTKSHFFVMLAAFSFSFILIFSTLLKNSGLSILEQVVLRLSLASIMLFFILLYKKQLRLPRKKDFPFFASIGVVFSLFLFSALSSLIFGVPIVVVVSLIYTQPIFTALISFLTKTERIAPLKIGIILISMVGVVLVTGLSLSEILNLKINLGIISALSSGFFYGLYLWLKRRVKRREYMPLQSLFNTFLFAIPSVLIIGLLLRNFTSNPMLVGLITPNTYQLGLLLLFAGFSTILPYGSLNFVDTKEISPTAEGLLLLFDPILHMFWAMIIFQQFVSLAQYLGAFLILVAAAINLAIK